MAYSFARVSAAVAMRVEDYYATGKRWWVRLHEKGGKLSNRFQVRPPFGVGPGAGQVSGVGLTGMPGFWRKAHAETPIPQRRV
jgi:hypothetical protein